MDQTISFRRGQRVRLSLPRRFMTDLMRHSKQIPSVPMQRRMTLGDLVAARARMPRRASWCAIFLKAYAILCARRPELRRHHVQGPFAHLYEHPEVIGSFSVERLHRGEPSVFFARIASPELLSLGEIDDIVRWHKNADESSVKAFRDALAISSLPAFLRRPIWWLALHGYGPARAWFIGTFAISVVAASGGAGLHLLSPLTTTLNYGVFEADGALDVRVTYDHRVLDGATVARCLVDLEQILLSEILPEMVAIAEDSLHVVTRGRP
jgi:hypothetical protein